MMTIFVSSPFIFSFIIFTAIFPFTTPMPDSANHCTDFTCGSFKNLNYPFGKNGTGCGDPDFQLNCDSNDDPYMYFKDGGSFRLKNPTVLDRDKGVVQLEILLNSTQPDCSTHLHQLLSSQPLPYGSNFSSDIEKAYESSDESKFWVCDVDSHGSLGSACGFYFFSPEDNYIPTCNHKIITFPTNTPYTPTPLDTLLSKTGLLLEATVPPDRAADCADCLGGNDINSCGFNRKYEFTCFCGDKACPGKHNNKHSTPAIIGGSVTGVGTLLALIFLGLLILHKLKTSRKHDINNDMHTMEASLGTLPIFTYRELSQATNFFSANNKLGRGGFATVFQGKLRDGRNVAVKKFFQDITEGLQDFMKEALAYKNLNHPRIVRLYGCSSPAKAPLMLVFELVDNGTLAHHLHGDGSYHLTWNVRLKIAIQIAEALAFLHNSCPQMLHRDVKSTNILLDENFDAKIADFGISRLMSMDATHATTHPCGTPGYIDPEYFESFELTEKSDVYSYGVVLMEIISSKRPVDFFRENDDRNLAVMAKSKMAESSIHELIDENILREAENNTNVKDMVYRVAELACRCLASKKNERPTMKEVVSDLLEIRHDVADVPSRPLMEEAGYGTWPLLQSPKHVTLNTLIVNSHLNRTTHICWLLCLLVRK